MNFTEINYLKIAGGLGNTGLLAVKSKNMKKSFFRKLLCMMGLHSFDYTLMGKTDTRHCAYCPKRQKAIPMEEDGWTPAQRWEDF